MGLTLVTHSQPRHPSLSTEEKLCYKPLQQDGPHISNYAVGSFSPNQACPFWPELAYTVALWGDVGWHADLSDFTIVGCPKTLPGYQNHTFFKAQALALVLLHFKWIHALQDPSRTAALRRQQAAGSLLEQEVSTAASHAPCDCHRLALPAF